MEYRGECGAGQTSLQAGETFPSGLAALCTSWTEIILVQNATTQYYSEPKAAVGFVICQVLLLLSEVPRILCCSCQVLDVRAILQKALCFSDPLYLYGTSVLHIKRNVLITFFPCAQFNENCLFIPFLIPQ